MQSNHTPGPWTLGDENDPLVFSPVAGAYVAQVLAYDGGSLRSNYAADAALIAAAPELLAALRDARVMIHAMTSDAPVSAPWNALLPRVDAAIARATGVDHA